MAVKKHTYCYIEELSVINLDGQVLPFHRLINYSIGLTFTNFQHNNYFTPFSLPVKEKE